MCWCEGEILHYASRLDFSPLQIVAYDVIGHCMYLFQIIAKSQEVDNKHRHTSISFR